MPGCSGSSPRVQFERYCDDAVAHCVSERQDEYVRAAIVKRLAEVNLEVHPEKTRIVYCRDGNRKGKHEHERFNFRGFTFRARQAKNQKTGTSFVGFLPAVSDEAGKAIRQEIRGWKLHPRSGSHLKGLAQEINQSCEGGSTKPGSGSLDAGRLPRIKPQVNDVFNPSLTRPCSGSSNR